MIRTTLAYLICFFYIFFALVFVLPIVLMRAFGMDQRADQLVVALVQSWARVMIWSTGSRAELLGHENLPAHDSFCLVSNHQSNFDIPLILGFIPRKIGFVAKHELGKVPFLSTWMQIIGCVLIDRRDGQQAVQIIRERIELAQQGHPIVIFPEGSRSKDGQMRPFKQGGLRAVFDSGITIVPVTVSNTFPLFEQQDRLVPQKLFLNIHPAVETRGLAPEDFPTVVEQLRQTIEQGIQEQPQVDWGFQFYLNQNLNLPNFRDWL